MTLAKWEQLRLLVDPFADTSMYFGRNCPVGKVQVEFVNVSPDLRYSPYGWKPSDSASIDVYIDGSRYHIQIGDCELGSGRRRGLYIIATGIEVDKHSINACYIGRKE